MKQLEIHVITDGVQTVKEIIKKILMIHEEVDFLHIREKKKSASEVMEIVSALLENGVSRDKIIINDRLDVVQLQQLSNIHLPGNSFSIQTVKEFMPSLKIGRSVHTLEEAIASEKAGADYLMFGHLFATKSKAKLPPRGVELLEDICRSVSIPVIAIGGIVPETVSKLSNIKLGGMAIMSYVMASDNPSFALQQIKESLLEVEKNEQTL
ncbi:thiamine phosphate synthase [Metabacillus niabensis]|uniref:thiamine phosphate synthase n=1 Tax=Metabacillus niabensis TaxID=324854 RepID=UPI003671871A